MLYFPRWKKILIWLAIVGSVIVALPNMLSDAQLKNYPSFLPQHRMTLGLDLQGGSYMMLKIDRAEIVKDRVEATIGDIRSRLREAAIRYTALTGNGQQIQVRITEPEKVEAAKKALNELLQPISTGTVMGTTITEATLEDLQQGLLRISLTDDGINYRMSSALAQSTEVVRRRVDQLGNTEPLIQRQGSDRIAVQVPGLSDPQRLKNLLNQTAKLTFHMVDTSMSPQEAINTRPPATSQVLYGAEDSTVPYLVEKQALISGENLVDAQASFNQQTNEPVVTFRFDSRGSQRFAQATQQNVGRPFAIVLDDKVISAPVIREPIVGGSGQISGNFTVQSANDLAVLLRAGALPATLTVVEERTVGPSLGADSIRAGVIAGIVASLLVIVFMLVFYGFFGVLAIIALVVNILMTVAILTMLGSTLTLPGIAGIVLTIGMAVDSNVLIYERIREEAKSGKSLIQAVDLGFNRAFGTIVDANVTALIAAVVLFYLGTGPVRGFAVTHAIGIATTIFTAFTLTNWLFAEWIHLRRPKHLPNGIRTGIFDFTGVKFMGIRRWTFTVSVLLVLGSVVGFGLGGLNLGVDFKGGSVIELRAKQGDAKLGEIRERLDSLGLGEVQAQNFGDASSVLVRIASQGAGEGAEQAAIAKVRAQLDSEYDFRRVEVVGPAVSGELSQTATIGVLGALLGILVYIWFRFEWQFAVGAILATIHDVILTLGIFVVSGIEFNLTSIAAILTVVGYSLNDTVVVYDRLRENMRKFKKMPLADLIDLSINETMSRTILTMVTTLLALIALFLFGGEVIRSFTFAMIAGVVVATFSSIYIAAPILIAFRMRPDSPDAPAKAGGKPAGGATGAKA